MIYTIDANVFVDATRQPEALARLKSFLGWALPSTVLSSVVAAELARGARTEFARRALESDIVELFRRRGRLAAPSADAWNRSGALLSRADAQAISASRQNDVLLAHQAREYGWCIITRDRDFESLRRQIRGLRVSAPFPSRK